MIPINLATEQSTVNIEWIDRQHYIVLDRSLFYQFQSEVKSHTTFWHSLTAHIQSMIDLRAIADL